MAGSRPDIKIYSCETLGSSLTNRGAPGAWSTTLRAGPPRGQTRCPPCPLARAQAGCLLRAHKVVVILSMGVGGAKHVSPPPPP